MVLEPLKSLTSVFNHRLLAEPLWDPTARPACFPCFTFGFVIHYCNARVATDSPSDWFRFWDLCSALYDVSRSFFVHSWTWECSFFSFSWDAILFIGLFELISLCFSIEIALFTFRTFAVFRFWEDLPPFLPLLLFWTSEEEDVRFDTLLAQENEDNYFALTSISSYIKRFIAVILRNY